MLQCRNTKQAPSPVTHVVCHKLVQFGNIPRNRRYAVAFNRLYLFFVSCPTEENRMGYHSFGRQEPQMATVQDSWNMSEAKNQHFCSSTATSAQTKGYAVYHWLLKNICCWNRPECRSWTEQHTQTNMHPAYLGLEGPKQCYTLGRRTKICYPSIQNIKLLKSYHVKYFDEICQILWNS